MKCEMCGKEIYQKTKTRSGCICANCYNSLPIVIRKNGSKLSAKEICEIRKIITNHKSESFTKCENIYICDESIQINEWEVKFKDLRKIELNFHPKAVGNGRNMAYGILSVIIETKKPHIIIEEAFMDTKVEYRITGKTIHYFYPNTLKNMFDRIQMIIDNKTYNMKDLREEMRIKREQRNKQAPKDKDTPFDIAKKLYGVEIPYTEDLLKEIRNRLIKENHPDQGGSAEFCAKINSAYDLLRKFASP